MLSFKEFVSEEANLIESLAIEAVGGEDNYNQLDELSKKTLGSYINKAAAGSAGYGAGVAMDATNPNKLGYGKSATMLGRRLTGINKAVKKLAKEDLDLIAQMVEDDNTLNELSKKTLGKYINKAVRDAGAKTGQAIALSSSNMPPEKRGPEQYTLFRKVANREIGVKKAVKRLTKESVDLTENYQMDPMDDGMLRMSKLDHLKQAEHHRTMWSHHKAEAASARKEAKNHPRHMNYKLNLRAIQHENSASLERYHAEMHEAEAKRKN